MTLLIRVNQVTGHHLRPTVINLFNKVSVRQVHVFWPSMPEEQPAKPDADGDLLSCQMFVMKLTEASRLHFLSPRLEGQSQKMV